MCGLVASQLLPHSPSGWWGVWESSYGMRREIRIQMAVLSRSGLCPGTEPASGDLAGRQLGQEINTFTLLPPSNLCWAPQWLNQPTSRGSETLGEIYTSQSPRVEGPRVYWVGGKVSPRVSQLFLPAMGPLTYSEVVSLPALLFHPPLAPF